MYTLVPNVQQLEANLQQFATIIDADEVLLFEKATFLVNSTPIKQIKSNLIIIY